MSPDDRRNWSIPLRIREVGIPLIGRSPPFLNLLQTMDRVASHSHATVIVHGETGTGKELIARAIHYMGERRDHPFVPVNCGALPESLAENELFGHCSGAFTGASNSATGLVRLADRGTLFLDEVDSLPAKTQVALLRFLQDGRFRALGAGKEERVDVRIICATNQSLPERVRAGAFREDLFYRLNLLTLQVPPLRKRTGDVAILAEHFARECARRYGKPYKRVHANTLAWFAGYEWPGNVRELENVVHSGYLLCDGDELVVQSPHSALESVTISVPALDDDVSSLPKYQIARKRALEEFDRNYLERALRQTSGNITKAAELVGKERRALGKLLKRYQIDTTAWR